MAETNAERTHSDPAIHCDGCAGTIEEALEPTDGVVRRSSPRPATRRHSADQFVLNVRLIPAASSSSYPFNGWVHSPVLAAAAMALSSVTLVTNSLRLRSISLD